MVEPITLGLIAAMLASKVLDRAGDGVIDGGVEVMEKVVSALRERFSREGDEDGEKALERLADAPDSPSRVRELARLIDDRTERSPDLRAELEALVEEAKDAGINVGSITQTAEGEQIVQNAGVIDSQVNVNQGTAPRPRD